ncbi:MAG: glycerol-3-phosphate dehydrogenase [Actinomyces graevenitzii]|nr:glycerol-3-phosphate dehydrogenase [Actinomyces graevenitzii]
MYTITILGAGAMGSALSRPLIDTGWQVRLWGTWLDDHLLDAIENGQPHPRINATIDPRVQTYRSNQLQAALDGADVAVMAVASHAVNAITELALPQITKTKTLWLTSKGFNVAPNGQIQLLPDAIRAQAQAAGLQLPPIMAIAGPVKANECALGLPTATIFACTDQDQAQHWAANTNSGNYAPTYSQDEIGVELCAAMKNVYAIALGIADGLETATKIPHHNLKAAAFAQAIKEMSQLCANLGGQTDTPYGLAGIGDLEVTGLSGRNKIYGTRLGQGQSAPQAYKEMQDLEQTVEGVSAAALAVRLVAQFNDPLLTQQLPLLHAVAQILAAEAALDVEAIISQAVLPQPAAPIADMVRIYGQDSGADKPEF